MGLEVCAWPHSSYIQKLRATVETVLHPSMTKGVCIGGCLDRQKKKKGGDIRYVLVERNYGECFAIFFRSVPPTFFRGDVYLKEGTWSERCRLGIAG